MATIKSTGNPRHAPSEQHEAADYREQASHAIRQARGIVDLLFMSTASADATAIEELDGSSLNAIFGALLDRLDEARESLDAMVQPS
jgi:hypothetical protein